MNSQGQANSIMSSTDGKKRNILVWIGGLAVVHFLLLFGVGLINVNCAGCGILFLTLLISVTFSFTTLVLLVIYHRWVNTEK